MQWEYRYTKQGDWTTQVRGYTSVEDVLYHLNEYNTSGHEQNDQRIVIDLEYVPGQEGRWKEGAVAWEVYNGFDEWVCMRSYSSRQDAMARIEVDAFTSIQHRLVVSLEYTPPTPGYWRVKE